MRIDLYGAYEGHWIDIDPTVPLVLYERTIDGDQDALADLVRLGVVAWSLQAPVPRADPDVLEAMPWDWWLLVPRAIREAGRLLDDEADDILQRVGVGQSTVRIPELERFRLCDRLGIPYRQSYEELGAVETFRLAEALGLEVEYAKRED